MNDTQDERFDNPVVAIVKLRKSVRIFLLDAAHELEVSRLAGLERRGHRGRTRFGLFDVVF